MTPRYRSLKTTVMTAAAMLAVCISAATVMADQKPADPPKTPPIKQKKLLMATQKPAIGQKLMARPKQPPIERKRLAASKNPMAVRPMADGVEARLVRLEEKLDAVMRELLELRREQYSRPPASPMSSPGPGPAMRHPVSPPHQMHGWAPRRPYHGPVAHQHHGREFSGPAPGPRSPKGARPEGLQPGSHHPGHHGHHAGPPSKPKPPAGPTGGQPGMPKPKHEPGRIHGPFREDGHGGLPYFHPRGGPSPGSPGGPKPPIPPKGKHDAGSPKASDAF